MIPIVALILSVIVVNTRAGTKQVAISVDIINPIDCGPVLTVRVFPDFVPGVGGLGSGVRTIPIFIQYVSQGMGCILQRVVFCGNLTCFDLCDFLTNLNHGIDESIQFHLGLALGWFMRVPTTGKDMVGA